MNTLMTICVLLFLCFVSLSFAESSSQQTTSDCVNERPTKPEYVIDSLESLASQTTDKEEEMFGATKDQSLKSILYRVAQKDKKALKRLFRSVQRFEGAPRESIAFFLFAAMYHLGDDFFSDVLRKESASIRKEVISLIDYASPINYKINYPKTYALTQHKRC